MINNDKELNKNKMLFTDDLIAISKNGRAFLYNRKNGKSLIGNENILRILDDLKNGRVINKKINNLLEEKELIKGKLNKDINKDFMLDKIKNGIYLRNLRLNVTEKCNLNCSYCYEKSSSVYTSKRTMSWDIAKKTLDEFVKVLLRNGHTDATIRFFGGEPLLNFELVEKSMEYIVSTYSKDIRIEFIINTNGILITKDIAKQISNYKSTLVISLDGIKEHNDKARIFHNGMGSFDIINNNINNIYKTNNINIAIVCTDDNYLYLKEFIDYIINKQNELGRKINICFNNLRMCDENYEKRLSAEEKIKLLMEAIRYARSKGINCYGGLTHQVFNNVVRPNSGRHCVCLGAEFSVDPDGKIYPCDGLGINLGDINNVDDIFTSSNYLKLINRVVGNVEYCKECDIEYYCAGGCYADYLSDKGKMCHTCRDCEFERMLFKEFVKEYLL